jgi:type II secretory pathway pseudopilin PulG
MTTTETSPIDEVRLEAFVGEAVTDMGAAISGLLLHIGDRLGLYRAMAGAGPVTPAELAARTGTAERYVREWLGNQAAGGYVTYDPAEGSYELPAEQAMVVANEDSPFFLAGAFEVIASCYADHGRFTEAFRTGAGVGWHEHDDRLFSGVLRFFRPGYAAHLVNAWLLALDGVADKLRAGASVADVGCGLGAPTIIMAQAFGRSTFLGVDNHEASITEARQAAAEAGVASGPGSRPRPPTSSPAPATTWCACSTACTTWATRWGRPGASASRARLVTSTDSRGLPASSRSSRAGSPSSRCSQLSSTSSASRGASQPSTVSSLDRPWRSPRPRPPAPGGRSRRACAAARRRGSPRCGPR